MNTTTLRRLRPDLLTEAQFSGQVAAVARLAGWRRYHTFDSRRSNHGFPDWVLAKPPRLIFAELKSETGKLRPAQEDWLDALHAIAAMNPLVEVYLWRPSDWDQLVETLTGRRPRTEAA